MSVELLTEAQIKYFQEQASANRQSRLQAVLPQTLVIKRLLKWQYKEKLSGIPMYKLTLMQADFGVNDLYLERNVNIQPFGFRGIITKIEEKDDDQYVVEVSSEFWHLTRRIYKIAATLGTVERNMNTDGVRKEYRITTAATGNAYKLMLESILNDANLDSTKPFGWKLSADAPSNSTVNFKANWKSHFEILRTMALQGGHDLWFEDRLVHVGKRGKLVDLESSDKLYTKLTTKTDIKKFGNVVSVVGSKRNGRNLFKSNDDYSNDDMIYKHERVISNNKLAEQTGLDFAALEVFKEMGTITPDINMDVTREVLDKYLLEAGDVIRVIGKRASSHVKGYYRIVEMNRTETKGKLKLQYSRDGKFIPRVMDSLDIIEALMIKLKDLEIEQ